MTVREVSTGRDVRISIGALERSDLKKLTRKRYFFDWKVLFDTGYIYKLCLKGDDDVKGLMLVKDYPEEYRIEVKLLAASRENVIFENESGKKVKEYDGIAGNLLAYAARIALTRYGEKACVSLVPKTSLKHHYMKEYGMLDAGLSVYLELNSLLQIIKKFKV